MHRLDRTVTAEGREAFFAGSEDQSGVEGIADLGRIHGAVIEEFKSRHPQIPGGILPFPQYPCA